MAGTYGHCVGDALGLPVQFEGRDYFIENKITGMTGYRLFDMPPGSWSDDASLSFCLMESLTEKYDLRDIANNFAKWLAYGYWSSAEGPFDVGKTCSLGILNFLKGAKPEEAGPTGERSIGNGSIMRVLPLAYYLRDEPLEKQIPVIHDVSAITHAHPAAKMVCTFYVLLAINLLKNNKFNKSLELTRDTFIKHYSKDKQYNEEFFRFDRILHRDFSKLYQDVIISSGYAIHTLETALWVLTNNDNYKDTVLSAVNLGGDTDSIAATAGGLAGIMYGYHSIPQEWIDTIIMKDKIDELCRRFSQSLNLSAR